MKLSIALLTLLSSAMAATVPSQAWTTLTPSGKGPSCAVSSYSKSFGIAISTITTEVNVKDKRDVATQIGDGQVQATTATTATQSKVATTASPSKVLTTASPSSSLTTSTSRSTAPANLVSQISDGQIQKTTATFQSTTITREETYYVSYSASSVSAVAANHPEVIVTQITDGQIQVPNPTPEVAPSVIVTSEHGGLSSSTSYYPITYTSSFSYRSISSLTPSSSIQSSKTSASASASACATNLVAKEATCKTDSDLAMTLENGILIDSHKRIGSIVANRQFQFDGPTPQSGAIYANGWSIADGHLVLGDDYIFWQCLSGTFYNLYDESIADQCVPVVLNVIDLVDC